VDESREIVVEGEGEKVVLMANAVATTYVARRLLILR